MSEKKKFLLRIDTELFASLEKWAADDLRSVNSQIEYVLTNAVRSARRMRTEQGAEQGGNPSENAQNEQL
jgi:hypothetical protein